MLRKALAGLFVAALTGAAYAAPPASDPQADPSQPQKMDTTQQGDTATKRPKLGAALNVLHAVAKWSSELSQMADTKAKSQLVKDYAKEMATANAEKDAKLMEVAKKHGIAITALDPQTEEGKSMLDRMKAEQVLLRSLQGDAFDKEYMTLVTNTQQSFIHFLETQKAAAKDDDVKQLLGDMETAVQKRLSKAQEIMTTVYGDSV
jgi:predicted outer membrane protein